MVEIEFPRFVYAFMRCFISFSSVFHIFLRLFYICGHITDLICYSMQMASTSTMDIFVLYNFNVPKNVVLINKLRDIKKEETV